VFKFLKYTHFHPDFRRKKSFQYCNYKIIHFGDDQRIYSFDHGHLADIAVNCVWSDQQAYSRILECDVVINS